MKAIRLDDQFEHLITEYLDGEISLQKKDQLEELLKQCSDRCDLFVKRCIEHLILRKAMPDPVRVNFPLKNESPCWTNGDCDTPLRFGSSKSPSAPSPNV